jgi:hypothetical protein
VADIDDDERQRRTDALPSLLAALDARVGALDTAFLAWKSRARARQPNVPLPVADDWQNFFLTYVQARDDYRRSEQLYAPPIWERFEMLDEQTAWFQDFIGSSKAT